jgi:hypothetical protein
MIRAARLSFLMVIFTAPAFAGESVAPVKAGPVEKPTVKPAEKAPADFPFTLQGFFGKGADVQVSLREKSSSRSLWLKPGEIAGKWKLESADGKASNAVFILDGRRVELRLAGERAGTPTLPDLSKLSIVERRRATIMLTHRASYQKFGPIFVRLLQKILSEHPEYQDATLPRDISVKIDLLNPKAAALIAEGLRREFSASTDPDILLISNIELSMMDALADSPPSADEAAAMRAQLHPSSDPETARSMNEISAAYSRRLAAETDRLFLSRGGSPTLDDLPPPDPPRPPEPEEESDEKPKAD